MKRQKKSNTTQIQQDIPKKINAFFDKYEKGLVFLSIILGVFTCFLLFDVKVSLSGDDCDYLVSAEDFWHHFRYPGYHGALYPIVISPFIGIFGYNLILVKSIGCIFMLTFLWFFYKSYKGKVANVILIPALFLVSINSYLFFYASQTYSEALFMLIQGVFFFYLFKHFSDEKETVNLKSDWKKYIIIGLIILAMGLTRSIGYAAIGALILFFSLQRQWKHLLYSVASFGIIFLLFHLFKSIIWPTAGSGGGYDLNTLFAKDYYNPIERESFSGLCTRFIDNLNIYISNFLCQFLGVIKEQPSNYIDLSSSRTILLFIFFFVCVITVFRKNKFILFSGIYSGVMLFGTFTILHSFWAQDRLIVVFYPFILILFLGGIYYLLQVKKIKKLFFIYPIIIVILLFGTASISKNRISRNLPVLQQNMLGNQLYGLTPDWVNFIKASKWAAENLDKNAVIISRKPTISKVYTGRDFASAPGDVTTSFDELKSLKAPEGHTLLVVSSENNHAFRSPYILYTISITNSDSKIAINNKKAIGAFIYMIPNEELGGFLEMLNSVQLNHTLDYENFIKNIQNINTRIHNLEKMTNQLIESGTDYLLLAQLRVDPTQNTGVFINNIHIFVWYISYKYPERFNLIHTIGDQEPCEIIQFIR